MITGDTSLSVNFPEVRLSHAEDTYRFVHVHNNVPGILAKVNKVLAKNKINVEGQYLKTNEQVGYVITESNKPCKAEAVKELQSIPETIKFRTLY
jgi:D-3-phosphoglycerate dehydrogenase